MPEPLVPVVRRAEDFPAACRWCGNVPQPGEAHGAQRTEGDDIVVECAIRTVSTSWRPLHALRGIVD